MSRSWRKTPIIGNCAGSDKQDTCRANRKARTRNRVILRMTLDDSRLKGLREVSNVWLMQKDGKLWFGNSYDNDADLHAAMRK